MRSVGFTGTQAGLMPAQRETFTNIVRDARNGGVFFGPMESFHHGDCIGADAEAHEIVSVYGFAGICIHPPEKKDKRAFCKGAARVRDPRPYLERNHDIVNAAEGLIACPRGYEEELRSGTWATVRYARKSGRPILIIWPSGKITLEVPHV